MSKYVALQDILHNGRMHSPGEVINCPDPKLAQKWIKNHAVKAVGVPETPPIEQPAADTAIDAAESEQVEAIEAADQGAPEQPENTEAPPKLGRRSGSKKQTDGQLD